VGTGSIGQKVHIELASSFNVQMNQFLHNGSIKEDCRRIIQSVVIS
jgi:hypothetical protein